MKPFTLVISFRKTRISMLGLWNRLELQIRQWAKKYGTLFVVTGGVLEDGLEEIGAEDVDVPRYFYKIVARGDTRNPKLVGFLMLGVEEHQTASGICRSHRQN